MSAERQTAEAGQPPLMDNGCVTCNNFYFVHVDSYVMQQQGNCLERCFLLGPWRCYRTRTRAPDKARHQDLLIGWRSVEMWLLINTWSNTSTIVLRVVGGDKKESIKSETVKYGREYHGTRIREWMRWRGTAVTVNNRHILSSERMLCKNYDCVCSFEEKKILAVCLEGLGAKTKWLAVYRQS
jgi:hypothetical protein